MEKLLWTQTEFSLWNKWIGKQTCGKCLQKKCVLELDEWTFFTRNTCRDCWGRTEAHWFLVELWDFLWFIANTMKLNNSLCYSTLTMCRVCCLSNQCVKDFVFQQESWSLSQEVLFLLWCSYCEIEITLYIKQKSLDEKSFHIISKIVNKMVSCLTEAISDIPYCMSTTTCYPWSKFVV